MGDHIFSSFIPFRQTYFNIEEIVTIRLLYEKLRGFNVRIFFKTSCSHSQIDEPRFWGPQVSPGGSVELSDLGSRQEREMSSALGDCTPNREASWSEDLCFSTLRNSHAAFWHSSLQQELNFHDHHHIARQYWCLAISCSVVRLFFRKLRLPKSNNASISAEESLSHILTHFICLI